MLHSIFCLEEDRLGIYMTALQTTLNSMQLLQAAMSSRCRNVLLHALEAKAGKDAYISRPHSGNSTEQNAKRRRVDSEEEM